ncbi:hypothetical protein SASPL_141390 [Salvia splendens]|uniref:Agenet domain-containing protein n=1 Tax=Salvia splendens TaxID=180675 RepID=A0A8X8WSY3_SALSN|nr:hypothetical protein SASPL_141390 [Salvia splendens]
MGEEEAVHPQNSPLSVSHHFPVGEASRNVQSLLASKGRSDNLRPLPPPSHKAGKGFEVNDFVEAYYKDGLWEGVVTAVVDGGERFVVTFENLRDEREFAPLRLRPL